MLYHVPLEPYQTRYTAEWQTIFNQEFTGLGVAYQTIYPPYSNDDRITVGSVLDASKTMVTKSFQLQTIMQKFANGDIKDGDVFFFADLWFPGIEMLFYVRNMTKIKFKIYGILHAGTYDKNDFTAKNDMKVWGERLERAWFNEFDGIFVATKYHKDLIEYNRLDAQKGNNIYVTGLPFDLDNLPYQYSIQYDKQYNTADIAYGFSKENIVVFPHRNNDEKQGSLFTKLAKDNDLDKYGLKFVRTLDVCDDRKSYFELLRKAKYAVSFAKQETFGFSMIEAYALGAIPIVPNRLSYPEIFPPKYIYQVTDNYGQDYYGAKKLLLHHLKNPKQRLHPGLVLGKYKYAIANMVNLMEGNIWDE